MGFSVATYNKKKLAEELGIEPSILKSALNASRMGGNMKIWRGEVKEQKGYRFFEAQASTSSRKDQDSPWETDWNGFVTFAGKAMDKILSIGIPEKGGLSIIVTSAAVKSKYDKARDRTYTNYIIYDFDTYESTSAPARTSSGAKPQPAAEEEYADLPF